MLFFKVWFQKRQYFLQEPNNFLDFDWGVVLMCDRVSDIFFITGSVGNKKNIFFRQNNMFPELLLQFMQ